MKRTICVLMIVIMTFSLAGCGGSTPSKPSGNTGNNTVQNVLNQQIKDSEATGSENTPVETQKPASAESNTKPEDSQKSEATSYDVDLTRLSSTMIYSEVYNMMSEPEKYIGKSIRMNGQFALYQATDEEGKPIQDQIYFACVIADATACCSQGLEFVLADELVYPDDYPELGTEITVSGTFETYDENGYMYCHLINAVFE